MEKKVKWLGAIVIGAFVLSGCSTMGGGKDLKAQGLRNQNAALESQPAKIVESSNLEQVSLESSPAITAPTESLTKSLEDQQRPKAKKIQEALKNAGFYQGNIDGKLGKQSRQAIRDFQKANNLEVDGKVGKNTWELLKEYQDKKVK